MYKRQPQRPFSGFLVASVFKANPIDSFSASHRYVELRDDFNYWIGNPKPLEPPPPNPHHLAPSCIHYCLFCSSVSDCNRNQVQYPWFDSGSRELGNRMDSWVFVTAQFLGDLGMAIFDPTFSALESLSTVSVSVLGALNDKKLRSVADNGTMTRTEAQLSLRSLSPCFFFSVFASLIDGISSLTCDDEWSAFCLSRTTKIDYA